MVRGSISGVKLGIRKARVLYVEKICKESQVLIDIFVNYDCDVDAPNIFERYVTSNLVVDECLLFCH